MRFGSSSCDDPMENLTKLKQVGSVFAYKGQFEALSNRIKELSEKHRLSCFLSGLRDDIRLPIRMLNPQNLNAAFGLAKIQEEYLFACKQNVIPWGEVSKPSILGPPPIKNDLKTTKLPVQKLIAIHVEERKKKGLCFHCEDKWYVGQMVCGTSMQDTKDFPYGRVSTEQPGK